MRPFQFMRADDRRCASRAQCRRAAGQCTCRSQYLAGGTTLLDLMKLDVMRPERVVDINELERPALGTIESARDGLRLGALVRMARGGRPSGRPQRTFR